MRLLFLAIMLFAFCACSNTPNQPNFKLEQASRPFDTAEFNVKRKKIDAYFKKLNQNTGFNGAVYISKDEHLLYSNAFGFADIIHKKVPLSTKSIFQLASVSKQFTAAAIIHLMEQGKLSLSDDVKKYYPKFPYDGITIKLLLAHRGGLGNYTYFSEHYCDRRTPLSNQDVVEMMIQNKPPIYFLPDKRFDYSNTGYAILAAIIEKITEKPFSEYMKEEIFDKLEMKNTFIYSIKNRENKSVPGHSSFGGKTVEGYLDGVCGDKGAYSTVEDLAIWDRVLYSNAFLKKENIDSICSPANHHLKGPFNYGYGWRTYTFEDGKEIVYHGGWWNGFKTFFYRDLYHHNSVIILSNRENSGFRNLDELYNIIYDRKPNLKRKFSAYMHHSPGF